MIWYLIPCNLCIPAMLDLILDVTWDKFDPMLVKFYSTHKALLSSRAEQSTAQRCFLLNCLAFSVITGLVLMDLLKCKYRSSDGVFCVQYSPPRADISWCAMVMSLQSAWSLIDSLYTSFLQPARLSGLLWSFISPSGLDSDLLLCRSGEIRRHELLSQYQYTKL